MGEAPLFPVTATALEPLPLPAGAPRQHPQLGKPVAVHVYADATGIPQALVYRFPLPDNRDKSAGSPAKSVKEFRPYDLHSKTWKALQPTRPLYRLDLLSRFPDAPIILVEGEKCADTLNRLGLLAVTTWGGSNGLAKAELSPLAGRQVVIWPDADSPGLAYARKAAETLQRIGAASVRIVSAREGEGAWSLSLKGRACPVPQGFDAADAVAEGWSLDSLRVLLSEAERVRGDIPSDQASLPKPTSAEPEPSLPVWEQPDRSVLNPRPAAPPFPLEAMGAFWSSWIKAKAEGTSAPVDYVAGALLAATASLIGNSRVVSPWSGWQEPAFLWLALVGNPSSGKSPAMDPVLSLLRRIEQDKQDQHKGTLRQYQADRLASETLRAVWEKDVKKAVKEGNPPPPMPEGAEEPAKPDAQRLRTSDTTIEGLARLLISTPKGLLVERDELAGWFGSFDRYAGGNGGDRAFWLEANGGRPYTIDRARNGGESLTIPRLGVSILGGIQPEKLARTLLSGADDGLPARFLPLWPEPVPQRRPTVYQDDSEALLALRRLDAMQLVPGTEGRPEPALVRLTEPAAQIFADWRQAHAAAALPEAERGAAICVKC